MTYTVKIAPAAERHIKKLESSIQRRIIRRLEGLEANPRPPGVKKLSGTESLYRIRVGDYRIIYEIRDKDLVVLVAKVGHRGDVYRPS